MATLDATLAGSTSNSYVDARQAQDIAGMMPGGTPGPPPLDDRNNSL